MTADWTGRPGSATAPAYFEYTKPIHQSPQDTRSYRLIRLQNGLHAVLVHDSEADKAAASLDVGVGHLDDPEDMPGLAHFCEHLLFMGTKQFPKENEYSEFLSKNGGGSNAYTAAHNTNYYFNVGTKALPGALTRFASFFHSPLFTPSCTSRELNAVDSEHKKNLQDDRWRIFQVNKHLTKAGHPWSKFGSGHRESLTATTKLREPLVGETKSGATDAEDGGAAGRETRRRLMEWWSREYCASRMTMAIIGKEPLDELADLTASLFSPIQNRLQDPLPLINDHPFGEDEMGTLISVKTIMDFHCVEISFPMPWQAPHWRVKPANYIAHFTGHEGPGSLHAYLKNKGWITALSSGPQNLARGFGMFKVTVHLTKEGFANYRDVAIAVFKYFSLLRSSSLPEWVQREIQLISETRFRFQEKRRPDSYATWIAENLKSPIPSEMMLTAPTLTFDWDEAAVRDLLESFTVDRSRTVMMAKSDEHERISSHAAQWVKEPWYGTEHCVIKYDDRFIKEASAPNDILELHLPGHNEFIPENLQVDKKDIVKPQNRPHLIRETPLSTLWYKKDDQFWIPKAYIVFDIQSPLANTSARNIVMTRIYSDLVIDSLTEFSYNAELAGLQYTFGSTATGIQMILGGYNDKMSLLAKHLLERTRSLRVKEDRLAVMKEQYKLDLENFSLGQSYEMSDYYGRYILTERDWTITEKLMEISTITAPEVEEHIERLFSRVHVRTLVHGNIAAADAVAIVQQAEHILASEAVSPAEMETHSLIPHEGCNCVWELPVPNSDEVNSALTFYCHVGDIAVPKLRATFYLLVQILSEPTFDILRTKEQLGYIVASNTWSGTASMGLRILVQSERDPKYLEERVESFLQTMCDTIDDMSMSAFQEHKKGLQDKWMEKLKNLNEETNRFWSHIDSGYLDFTRRERDAQTLNEVAKEDVLNLFRQYIHPASTTRSKISIHLRSQRTLPERMSIAASNVFLDKLVAFNIPVDKDQYAKLSATEPPMVAVKEHWEKILLGSSCTPGLASTPEVARELLTALDHVSQIQDKPSSTDRRERGVTYITDVAVFKKWLKISCPAKPVEAFSDRPNSRF